VDEISESESDIQLRLKVGNETKIFNLKNVEFKNRTRVLFDMDEELLFPLLKLGDRRFANQGFYFRSLTRLLCIWKFERESIQFPVDLLNHEYSGQHPKQLEIYQRKLIRILNHLFKRSDNHSLD